MGWAEHTLADLAGCVIEHGYELRITPKNADGDYELQVIDGERTLHTSTAATSASVDRCAAHQLLILEKHWLPERTVA